MQLARLNAFSPIRGSVDKEHILVSNEKYFVKLVPFTIAEREQKFGVKIHVHPHTGKYSGHGGTSPDGLPLNELVICESGLLMECKNVDSDKVWEFHRLIDFVLRIHLKDGAWLTWINTSQSASRRYEWEFKPASWQREQLITEDKLKNIKEDLSKIKLQSLPKLSVLRAILITAMSELPNRGLSGALYVTILESLFVNDDDQQLSYKIAARMTNFLGENYNYFKNLRKLYTKRSKLYHQGVVKFTEEELVFLDIVSRALLSKYLKDPESFDPKFLDKKLIES